MAEGVYASPRIELAMNSYAPSCQGFRVAIVFAVDSRTALVGDIVDQRGSGPKNVQRVLRNNYPGHLKPVGVVIENTCRTGELEAILQGRPAASRW